jgi:hypothetical protein
MKCRAACPVLCYKGSNINKGQHMNFKFPVGQAVEFTPRGGKVGLFTVVRQMPEEYQALDRKYRIQSHHGTEWSAFEYDLTASNKDPGEYAVSSPMRTLGRH